MFHGNSEPRLSLSCGGRGGRELASPSGLKGKAAAGPGHMHTCHSYICISGLLFLDGSLPGNEAMRYFEQQSSAICEAKKDYGKMTPHSAFCVSPAH